MTRLPAAEDGQHVWPRRDRGEGRSARLVAIGLTVALMAITAAAAQTYAGSRWHGDVVLYHTHAAAFVEGRLTETPHLSWYPPLTLVPLLLPLLVAPDLPLYAFAFALEMSLLAGLGALLVRPVAAHLLGPQRLAAVMTYAAFALLAAFLIPLRFDIVPAMLVLASLAAAVSRRSLLAGALLGVGAAVKIYPVVALPALLAWYWFRSDRRDAWLAGLGFAAAVTVGFGVYLLFAPASPLDILRFHSARGLHLESLPGSAIVALSAIGLLREQTVVFSDFSFNLAGDGFGPALAITTAVQPVALVLSVAFLVLTYFRVRRRQALDAELLALGMTVMVLALILTNRVLSTQYVVWLLPFVPFLGAVPRAIALVAAALSMVMFPFAYDALISLSPPATGVLVARNLALVALLVAVLVELWRRAAVTRLQQA